MILTHIPQRHSVSSLYIVLLLFAAWQLTGCGRSVGPSFHQAEIARHLQLKEPQILFYLPRLSLRSPELLLGGADKGRELSLTSGIVNPLLPVIEGFLAAGIIPGTSSVVEVNGETRQQMAPLDQSEPVLFFYSGGWYLDYQRWPLDLQRYRLSYSIIAKLIPRGRVLSGGATFSVPRAAWSDICYHQGDYFSFGDWQKNKAQLLREEMAKSLSICSNHFTDSFKSAVSPATHKP